MDSAYLISLIVGAFFILLSIFGVGEHDDVDAGGDVDHDSEWDSQLDFGSGNIGFVDLLSIRALFLFAAFFGLTGVSLSALGGSEPITGVLATGTGLLIGLGGNFVIKKFAYEAVSSQVTPADLEGRTAKVLLPFSGDENGKILLNAGGKRIQMTARLFEGESTDSVGEHEEVVVVRINGRIAEVLKPD
jgi:hypothetical protein